MLGAQLRAELSRPRLDIDKIKSLCKKNPIGCIVDNKMRSRVWSILLLGCDTSASSVEALGPVSRLHKDIMMGMHQEDARVLDADVKRTRGYLPVFQDSSTQDLIRTLLTNYCLNTGMKYKQGMHELLAPFVALNEPPLPPDLLYGMFQAFIHRYLGPFFTDDECNIVKVAFKLFHLLLQYHDPVLAIHLDDNDFPPSLYATPWIMTLFAHNLEMYLVQRLWDTYLSLDDPTLIYYLALALLKMKREVLLAADMGEIDLGNSPESVGCVVVSVDGADLLINCLFQLPEIISHIRIQSPEDISGLLPLALEACQKTPLSFSEDLRLTTMDRRHILDDDEQHAAADKDASSKGDSSSSSSTTTSMVNMNSFGGQQVWHSSDRVKCVEITSFELVESLIIQRHAEARGRAARPRNLSSLHSSSTSGSPSLPQPPSSPLPLSPDRRPPPSYLVIDVRSSGEYSMSGGGKIMGALRLEPEVLASGDTLQSWLDRNRVIQGRPICAVGSRVCRRRRRRGATSSKDGMGEGDKLWRRLLFGEGDGQEDMAAPDEALPDGNGSGRGIEQLTQDEDTAEAFLRLLRVRGYPFLAKLRGSFTNLLQYLQNTRGGRLEPFIQDHDPAMWNRWRRRYMTSYCFPESVLIMEGLHDPMSMSDEATTSTALDKRLAPSVMESYVRAKKEAEKRHHTWATKALEDRIKVGVQRSWGSTNQHSHHQPGATDQHGWSSKMLLGKATKALGKADSWISANLNLSTSSSKVDNPP